MSESRTNAAGSQLWQVPLLIVSLVAFAAAVYLFSRPGPGPSLQERLEGARTLLRFERPEPAIGVLNQILTKDRPRGEVEGEVRLLLAEAIELAQRLREIDLPENHEAIVEQSRLGEFEGGRMTADRYRRWGRSLEALGRLPEAFAVYERAIEVDASVAPSLLRRMAEWHLRERDVGAAEAVLERYLQLSGLTAEERAWGLGERAELLIARRDFEQARQLLGEVLRLSVDETVRGHTAYRYGLCAWELGDDAEAERQLRLARQLLRVRHPADAEAAYLLGRIFEKRRRPDEALAFYRDVLVSHPDSPVAVVARLGRGVARLMKGEDAAGIADLEWAAGQLTSRPRWMALYASTARGSFERAESILSSRHNHQGALEVLALEKGLWETPPPPPTFWARVARAYEKRAEQVELAAGRVESASEREGLLGSVRQLRVRAGDAHFSHAMALALTDNEGYGEALLRAIELYDRASAVRSTIAALEVFTQERPSDPLTPDALLRLGRAYMVVGEFDKAIATFERNRFRYAGFVAATKSAVPLAQSLMAKGSAHFGRAERVLLGVVEDNPALTPEAEDYRDALFELAVLYYRQGRFEESIGRFDELLKRYPADPRRGQVLFWMADGYRRSAGLLGEAAVRLTVGSAAQRGVESEGLSDAERARRERLATAGELFDQVLQHYRERPPARDVERSHLRLAHFYRADCAFDLGDYERAVRLYDQAAFRYQDDASALSAYVQMVNALVALGRTDEARTVNERAKWLLRRMPAGAFSDGSFAMSRESWERWLQWSGESGLWPTMVPVGPMGGVGYGGAVAGAGNAAAGVENAGVQPR